MEGSSIVSFVRKLDRQCFRGMARLCSQPLSALMKRGDE
ncbi:hypothetical protein PATSB16_05370 [Pandoraea thiooxydans]|nr:hypothetical protein PATSB16_05370 [Pandoraea thiooxydans]